MKSTFILFLSFISIASYATSSREIEVGCNQVGFTNKSDYQLCLTKGKSLIQINTCSTAIQLSSESTAKDVLRCLDLTSNSQINQIRLCGALNISIDAKFKCIEENISEKIIYQCLLINNQVQSNVEDCLLN